MEYPLMVPSFQMKKFSKMNKNEAQQYFNWFISQIPIRLRLLNQLVSQTKGDLKIELDFSKESLVNLWSWYLEHVEIIPKTKEELDEEYSRGNEMTKIFVRKEKITTGWMAVAMDIAIYFAECLIRAHKELKWGVITNSKSLSYVNKPIVIGFKHNMELDPFNLIYVQTRKKLRELKMTTLY